MAEKGDSQLGPWTDGVFYNKAPEELEEGGISSMQNMELGSSGELKKRLGTVSYKTEDPIAGNPTVTACGEYRIPPSTTEVFMVAGALIYEHTGNAWSSITGDVTITAGDDNTFDWAVDEGNGVLHLTNGVNLPFKRTGSSGNATQAADDVDSRFDTAKWVAFFDNRIWWGNTDTDYDQVWYTDIGDTDTIVATSFLRFGNPVTGLVALRESLAVHTETGIHTITPTGNTEIPFQQEQVTNRGTVSGRSIVLLPGEVQMFIREDGIYTWDGGDVIEKVSDGLDNDYWDTVPSTRLPQSFALYYPLKNQAWFWIARSTGQAEPNEVIIWSVQHEAFFGPYVGSSTHFTRNCAGLIDGRPHFGTHDNSGSIGGTVQDHAPASVYNDDDDSDTGTAIFANFTTAAPAPEGSANTVRWLYARNWFDSTGGFTITVQQESSGIDGTSIDFSVDGGGFTLDTNKLDEEELGTVRMMSIDTDLTGYDPHTSLKFSNNNIDEFFTMRRTHPVYLPLGRIRTRKLGVD